MWVSQTYLTNLRADGAVSAYFLFESYRDDHARVERSIRQKLGNLALSFGDDAHVFVPSKEARASIEKEFNDWLHKRGLQGIELPGILVLQHSMDDPRSLSGDAAFISFSELLSNPKKADALLDQVSKALSELKDELEAEPQGFDKALQNLQLKPGIWGMGYDLKPHLINFIRRFRDRAAPRREG
jgi:hypothetical protein